ncbi:MAG: TerC/Alx family metal homeostasis membrane protein [Bacteroidota bacterium]
MIWFLFFTLLFFLLALDLGIFHKKNETISTRQSLVWTSIWIFVALIFGFVIYWIYDANICDMNPMGKSPTKVILEYYTGYIVEESLSLDNIFVMAIIFQYFKIESRYQHRVLFWGILGAIVFRLTFIFLGTAFIENFKSAFYVFGAILLFSAFKMMKQGNVGDEDFKKSFGIRILSSIYPIDWTVCNGRYFIRKDGRLMATSLMAALIVIEFSDILFALDSIPAIFSVTSDPFIIFSSNIFAILGLRNLFFLLSNMLDKFYYMKYSLIIILIFVSLKMLLYDFFHFNAILSLVIILSSLLAGVLISLIKSRKSE